ncbi:MAG TPA: class I tRNA ligase family protein, partial [Bacteroidales bacterium]|nr:class I tRNA ligase family protein [Bacteroidales bacterium]
PHLAEELWNINGNENSIAYEPWPEVNEEYLKEDTFEYPVSVNGKLRFKIELPVSMEKDEIGNIVLNDERAKKWLATGTLTNLIIVPNRIINIVIKN